MSCGHHHHRHHHHKSDAHRKSEAGVVRKTPARKPEEKSARGLAALRTTEDQRISMDRPAVIFDVMMTDGVSFEESTRYMTIKEAGRYRIVFEGELDMGPFSEAHLYFFFPRLVEEHREMNRFKIPEGISFSRSILVSIPKATLFNVQILAEGPVTLKKEAQLQIYPLPDQ